MYILYVHLYIYYILYIYTYIITFFHKRVLDYHMPWWKEQNNYVRKK